MQLGRDKINSMINTILTILVCMGDNSVHVLILLGIFNKVESLSIVQ